jgi:hypothetical protein
MYLDTDSSSYFGSSPSPMSGRPDRNELLDRALFGIRSFLSEDPAESDWEVVGEPDEEPVAATRALPPAAEAAASSSNGEGYVSGGGAAARAAATGVFPTLRTLPVAARQQTPAEVREGALRQAARQRQEDEANRASGRKYYSVTDISPAARASGCLLARGVYCCPWDLLQSLLPGKNLWGSGIQLRRLPDLQAAVEQNRVKRGFGSVASVDVFDFDLIAAVAAGDVARF